MPPPPLPLPPSHPLAPCDPLPLLPLPPYPHAPMPPQALGQATPEIIRELFNAALAGFVDNPASQKPVIEVKMDPVGEYTV